MLANYGDLVLDTYDKGYVIYREVVTPEFKKDGTQNETAGEIKRTNNMYYGRLDQAVSRLSALVGDGEGKDLASWLEAYKAASADVVRQCKEVEICS